MVATNDMTEAEEKRNGKGARNDEARARAKHR